jgi:hypothetical protein
MYDGELYMRDMADFSLQLLWLFCVCTSSANQPEDMN